MADTELDDLDTLLTTPGFQRFLNHVGQEWGPAGERFQRAVQLAASKGDADATHMLRNIIFAQTEIRNLIAWPQERLQALRGQARSVQRPEMAMSRRGAGL